MVSNTEDSVVIQEQPLNPHNGTFSGLSSQLVAACSTTSSPTRCMALMSSHRSRSSLVSLCSSNSRHPCLNCMLRHQTPCAPVKFALGHGARSSQPFVTIGHPSLQPFTGVEKLVTEHSSAFTNGNDVSQYTTIDLKSDSKGFGFNIVGGKDSPHIPGHNGIFVSVIKQGGPAYNDGRLSVGDLILSINGIDLINKTHDEAVAIFRSQTETAAQLVVEVAAENRILNEHFPADPHICAGRSPFFEDNFSNPGSMTPLIRYDKQEMRPPPTPIAREEPRSREEDNESVSSCTPSTHSYLDDVPRTPKRPMSYFDPRNPSLITEALYVSIGLAVISLGVYVGYRFIRGRRK